jgi:hypothetical protein
MVSMPTHMSARALLRPHSAVNGKTPAQKANIESDEAKWMSLIKKASQHQRFKTSS